MRIVTSGKNMEITEKLQSRLEKQIRKLDRYLDDNAEVQARFSQEKGARNIVEITIAVRGYVLRAEESSPDMYQSIDNAVDKIESQIRRHRTKWLVRRDRSGTIREDKTAQEAIPEIDADDESYELVRTKRFAVKPMEVDDAIAQMEMVGHNFFLFMNASTSGMCVVYRRNDGGYGLLEPEVG